MYLYYMYINMTSLASEEIDIDNSVISPDPCARLGRKG